MLRIIDQYFLDQPEPFNGCLDFLRKKILSLDKHVTEKWQYGMPFYYFHEHRFCYLWVHKKYRMPYLGIVDGKLLNDPDLISENRSRMKILLIEPGKRIPIKKIEALLQKLMKIYAEQSL